MRKVLMFSVCSIFLMADSSVNLSNNRYIHNSNSVKRVQSDVNTYIQLRKGLGKSNLNRGGSVVKANKNINLNLVNKSAIRHTSIGMKIKTLGSKVTSNKNKILDLLNKSRVENSTIGMDIDAK